MGFIWCSFWMFFTNWATTILFLFLKIFYIFTFLIFYFCTFLFHLLWFMYTFFFHLYLVQNLHFFAIKNIFSNCQFFCFFVLKFLLHSLYVFLSVFNCILDNKSQKKFSTFVFFLYGILFLFVYTFCIFF